MKSNSIWRKVISLKYGVKVGGWFSNSPRGSYGVGMWKEISKEIGLLKANCSFFFIGNEKRTRFWKDPWCNELPLSSSFPSLY